MKGNQFLSIREALGLSVNEMATAIGYTGEHASVTIREYERDAKPIPAYIARLVWLMHEYLEVWDAGPDFYRGGKWLGI